MANPLDEYSRKRDFTATPAPRDARLAHEKSASAPHYVIQKHAARQLHYDFRLELDGTLKSWAVPKGPCLDPKVKRLVVQVEDHPLDYAAFEGRIPEGHYRAGGVIVWDRGILTPLGDPHAGYAQGRLKFELKGEKLCGVWNLVRTAMAGIKAQWFQIKSRDEQARHAQPDSALSESRQHAPQRPSRRRSVEPASGITTLELAEYCARIVPRALPGLEGRPVALVRGQGGIAGELFFQRHADKRAIPRLPLLNSPFDRDPARLMVIDNPLVLVGAAQVWVVIDYQRNSCGASTRFLYSTRAREGLPVSVSIHRDELGALAGANTWDIRNLPARLERLGQNDPWAALPGIRQCIRVAMRKRLARKTWHDSEVPRMYRERNGKTP